MHKYTDLVRLPVPGYVFVSSIDADRMIVGRYPTIVALKATPAPVAVAAKPKRLSAKQRLALQYAKRSKREADRNVSLLAAARRVLMSPLPRGDEMTMPSIRLL